MQPAHFGDGDDAARIGELYTAWIRRILLQCEVRASPMIVTDERLKVPGQTALVEYDHVIEAFATDCPNDAFDIRTLPRGSWCRQYLFDSHRLDLLRRSHARRCDPGRAADTVARCPTGKLPGAAVPSTLQSDVQ